MNRLCIRCKIRSMPFCDRCDLALYELRVLREIVDLVKAGKCCGADEYKYAPGHSSECELLLSVYDDIVKGERYAKTK